MTPVGTTADGEFDVVNDLPGSLYQVSFAREAPTCRVDRAVRAWGTGATADLTVTNADGTPGNGWAPEFPPAPGQTVVSDRTTDLNRGSNVITESSAPHNATIAPCTGVTLGHLAGHTGGASPAARHRPARCTRDGDACAVGR